MSKIPRRQYAQRNHGRPCRVQGCDGKRRGIASYCRSHAERAWRYGHPLGRAIDAGEYATEKAAVAAFLDKHAESETLKAVRAVIDRWLTRAAAGEDVPGHREVARLAEHRISAQRIFLAAGSVFLYADAQPKRLPDDARLTYALALAVLNLVPREKRYGTLKGKSRWYSRPVGYVARREVGQHLRYTLAAPLANLVEAIRAEEEADRKTLVDLHRPFGSTNPQ